MALSTYSMASSRCEDVSPTPSQTPQAIGSPAHHASPTACGACISPLSTHPACPPPRGVPQARIPALWCQFISRTQLTNPLSLMHRPWCRLELQGQPSTTIQQEERLRLPLHAAAGMPPPHAHVAPVLPLRTATRSCAACVCATLCAFAGALTQSSACESSSHPTADRDPVCHRRILARPVLTRQRQWSTRCPQPDLI